MSERKPKFGDRLVAIHAGENNPLRHVFFVEERRRKMSRYGRPKPFYRCTDGQGLFCEYPPESVEFASPSVETETWRPMETAPKDGTEVMVWIEWPGHRGTSEGTVAVARLLAGGWLPSDDGAGFAYDPTHWMPLPAPPRTPSTGQHDKHSKACQHRNSTGQDDG